MHDFFNAKGNPDRLMDTLEAFITRWLGPRDPYYGCSEEALSEVPLPLPLKRLYRYAGEWPKPRGGLGWLFSSQDHLVQLPFLSERDGKLVFLKEDQGFFECGTEVSGDDPPVWVSAEHGPWRPLCRSLSQFLVTTCLQELGAGSRYSIDAGGLLEKLRAGGKLPIPLWRGDYVTYELRAYERGFYLVDGALLMVGGEFMDQLNSLCSDDLTTMEQLSELTGEEILDHDDRGRGWHPDRDMEIPAWIPAPTLEAAAIRHEQFAAFHAAKAAFFRQQANELADYERSLLKILDALEEGCDECYMRDCGRRSYLFAQNGERVVEIARREGEWQIEYRQGPVSRKLTLGSVDEVEQAAQRLLSEWLA